MVTHVYFLVEDAEVEVVACAELGFRHDKVVPFTPQNNPDHPSAWLENVFFGSSLLEGVKRLGEPRPKQFIELR